MTKKLYFDAVIIGGGFYGSMVALHLTKSHKFNKVAILEKGDCLFNRASSNNQYRVHNGYHYPRSYNTANRSKINSKRFIQDWPEGVINNQITSLYAIPKFQSKVSATQFLKFCRSINAKVSPANKDQKKLFKINKFDDVFEVEEYCFNPKSLKEELEKDLEAENITKFFNNEVTKINKSKNDSLKISSLQVSGSVEHLYADIVFNCSYSGLGQMKGDAAGPKTAIKHEIAELVYVKLPKEFSNYGVTVMDGPFFSFLPTINNDVHSLSHVRYSPHTSWEEKDTKNPYMEFNTLKKFTRFERMIRSAQKYLPLLERSEYMGSKFEIKTILEKNEIDDGRPILFEKDNNLKNLYYVLGSKIDNIYDVLDKIDLEFTR